MKSRDYEVAETLIKFPNISIVIYVKFLKLLNPLNSERAAPKTEATLTCPFFTSSQKSVKDKCVI